MLCKYLNTKCLQIFAQHCSPPQSDAFGLIPLLVKVFLLDSAFFLSPLLKMLKLKALKLMTLSFFVAIVFEPVEWLLV